jgi:hypothetical protein
MNMRLKHLAGALFLILLGCMIWLTMRRSESFVDAGRCGVDLPSCQGERIRCTNGYCKSDIPPTLPLLSPLPMTPPTAYPYL